MNKDYKDSVKKVLKFLKPSSNLELEESKLICQHDWQLIAKTFAPPVKNIPPHLTDSRVLERAIFGITTLLSQCQQCGTAHKEEMLGSDENQLTELLEKVEKFGMQYVKENDNVYAVAKWVPEVTDSKLPLR